MFEAKITIEAPELEKAINRLADAVSGFGKLRSFHSEISPEGLKVEQKEVPNPALVSAENEPQLTPVESVEPEPPLVNVPSEELPIHEPMAVPQSPVPPVLPVPPVAPVETPAPVPAKSYTFKQLSSAGANLVSDLGKMEQLVKLLNQKYGVPAITMIPEDRYPELAEDLISLGAVIKEE